MRACFINRLHAQRALHDAADANTRCATRQQKGLPATCMCGSLHSLAEGVKLCRCVSLADLCCCSGLLKLEVWTALVHIAVVACSPPALNCAISVHLPTEGCVCVCTSLTCVPGLACILKMAEGRLSPSQMAWQGLYAPMCSRVLDARLKTQNLHSTTRISAGCHRMCPAE